MSKLNSQNDYMSEHKRKSDKVSKHVLVNPAKRGYIGQQADASPSLKAKQELAKKMEQDSKDKVDLEVRRQ